jgi:hypothetical protein
VKTLRKLWWGEFSLGQAFWIFYVCGFVLSVVVGGIVSFYSRSLHAHNVGFLLGKVIVFGYMAIASVGVWRSAGPSWRQPTGEARLRVMAARFVVLLFAGKSILWLINGGALTLMAIATGSGNFDF